ncbi:asparaginase domain-containing protein [Paenibacillus arenilitoris]|uniref:asparaginase n=1 Tax=Paenibacillus arenilitoris TaxID=2772299 RepID=A0A927H3X0_9BACL|nr:asparaginase domain-containing protein [Paenibacillus arenilitoris]MBD2867796.1 asparaginase [Paenibacillus arenilitoris]
MIVLFHLNGRRKLLAPLLALALLGALLPGYDASVRAEQAAQALPTFAIPPVSEAHNASPLPNVIVVATGGTIAGAARDGDKTNFQNYAAGTYPMADMVAQLPTHETADVSTFQFGNKGSGGYAIKELYDLSLAVDAALAIYDSAVVTTGTDTMEEIAYFLDLTVRSEKPVVVTGAMRPWDVIGSDGPANLYQAIKVAGSNKTKWFGTVVMLNDVIHAAREVTKSNAHRMDTFETPMFGALGYVDDPAVRIYRMNARALKAGQPDWATPFDLRTISKDELPMVEIVYNYQEAGGGAIRALVEDGAKGIVTAGTGAGGISSKMSAARTEAIKQGVTFVSTTRTGSGSIDGGGNGIIAGDNLNPQHARMMLMLSLAFSDDFDTVKQWFETIGTQDIAAEDAFFGDTASHWAEAAIEAAVAAGIVKGYPDGMFKPNLTVTRSEFAVMLMNALDAEGEGASLTFTDAGKIGAWAKEAVSRAVTAEIVSGYPDGSFRPGASITRTEMVSMLAKAMMLEPEAGAVTGFADDRSIPVWAKSAVKAVSAKGIVQGRVNNKFAPNDTATRAEAVTAIMNMLEASKP